MTQVQRFRGGASASIEVELFPSLVSVQYLIEIPMGEEDAAAEEDVGWTVGETVNAVDKRLLKPLASEFVD